MLAQHGLAFLPYMAIKKEIYQKQIKIVNLAGFDLNCDVYSIHRPKEAVDNDELFGIIKYFITGTGHISPRQSSSFIDILLCMGVFSRCSCLLWL